MAAPGIMSIRRYSPSTRLRLQVLFARAWEALADTYHLQAVEFVRRLRSQLPLDEALDRFFREVGVPAAMTDTVRARALIALAPLIEDAAEPEEDKNPGWNPLRPDHLIGAIRRRAQYVEETNLECRLAASIADEAVGATHVRMALDVAELLAGECTPDEAIMHYVRSFNLPALDTQIIFRRAMACWAERDPLGLDRVEPVTPAVAVCASGAQVDFGGRIRLGLRAAIG
ncbi:MAG TPA: hypothetical protein VFR72_06255 [Gemmatimonadales bacterium]|jgi:hypothetical protein|nr:hypothetical protein [Gemmatimonadales bacterium]